MPIFSSDVQQFVICLPQCITHLPSFLLTYCRHMATRPPREGSRTVRAALVWYLRTVTATIVWYNNLLLEDVTLTLVYRQSPLAEELSLASRTLDCTTLFTYGLSPLRDAFVSLPITFLSELSQALLTLDLGGLVLPLLLVVLWRFLSYCCVIDSLPIRSRCACYAIPLVLWYS